MKILAPLLLAAALLSACAEPIPPEKIGYAGEWRAPNVSLIITPEGQVHYRREEGNTKVSIDLPIQRFEGDDFLVGVGPFTTKFVVSKPPFLVEGQYRMVVDGRELTRVRAFEGTRA
ncbi:MAG TPA: hypothetical protein VM073_02855 [Usitatibacter sp.]|nr:hypothetical protein [Usitatibacter sp.]